MTLKVLNFSVADGFFNHDALLRILFSRLSRRAGISFPRRRHGVSRDSRVYLLNFFSLFILYLPDGDLR